MITTSGFNRWTRASRLSLLEANPTTSHSTSLKESSTDARRSELSSTNSTRSLFIFLSSSVISSVFTNGGAVAGSKASLNRCVKKPPRHVVRGAAVCAESAISTES